MTKRIKKSSAFDLPRQNLLAAIATASPPINLKQLSLALGRNHAYLQQYMKRGSPQTLPEEVRYKLAELLDIDESTSRPNTWRAIKPLGRAEAEDEALLAIDFLPHPAHQNLDSTTWHIGRMFATVNQDITGGSPSLKLVVVGDDMMQPNISRGDILIIDTADTDPHVAGLFAIDAGDHIRVRYVEGVAGEAGSVVLRHETSSGFGIKQKRNKLKLLGRCRLRFGGV